MSKQERPDGSTKAAAMLDRMRDMAEEIPASRISGIIQALFQVGDRLILPQDEMSFILPVGNEWRIGGLSTVLLGRLPTHEQRFEATGAALKSCPAVFCATYLVRHVEEEHTKRAAGKPAGSEPLLEPAEVEELKGLALANIREAAGAGTLFEVPDAGYLLYAWKGWGGDKEVREWVAQKIKTDEGMVAFLCAFLSRGYTLGGTDRVPKPKYHLNPTQLEPFADTSTLAQRCAGLVESSPAWLTGEERIAVETFLYGYRSRAEARNQQQD